MTLGDLAVALNQNVAQLNAHMRNAAMHSAQKLDDIAKVGNGYYLEAKRFIRAFDEQRGLRYRPATISLSVAVGGAGNPTTGGQATFRISQTEDFLVQSIRTFIVMNAMQTEPSVDAELGLANGGSNVMVPSERIIMKAANTRLTLLNFDTKVPIMENEGVGFATLCPEAGGAPMIFQPDIVPGFIIPHNVTLAAQFAMQSTDAMFTTASTNYGVTLTGQYISRERVG